MRIEATIKNIGLLSYKDKGRFALFCVKQVEHLIAIPEAKECVRVVELWLDGKVSADDCRRVADAAYTAYAAAYTAYAAACSDAYYTAYYAARTATARTAGACSDAAYYTAHYAAACADPSVREACERYLYELLYINDIIEQTLLT